jgi:hypothetical protein
MRRNATVGAFRHTLSQNARLTEERAARYRSEPVRRSATNQITRVMYEFAHPTRVPTKAMAALSDGQPVRHAEERPVTRAIRSHEQKHSKTFALPVQVQVSLGRVVGCATSAHNRLPQTAKLGLRRYTRSRALTY